MSDPTRTSDRSGQRIQGARAIVGIGASEIGTVLSLGPSSRPTEVVTSCRADIASARRWLGTVRRVHRVEIEIERGLARARGNRHRLPFSSPVPLAVALGLAALGVPSTVVGEPI